MSPIRGHAATGEHWTVIDRQRLVADVEIVEEQPGECDHCPPYRMLARIVGAGRA